MRLIIEPDYDKVSEWAACYVASRINAANPTPEKPFVLGCPTGSSPLGMKETHRAQQGWQGFVPECCDFQHGRICRTS